MESGFVGRGMVGHGAIISLLEIWQRAPAPAYLFFGPRHLGKRTLAIRFVQTLLDDQRESLNEVHPDLVILKPEEGKRTVAVEAVRLARARLSERPMVAPRVVMFVPQADRLNEEGTNALLKVLEEPPAGAVFVLVADDPTRLPATLRSRVVGVPFSAVPRAQIETALIERGVSSSEAVTRATECRGRPGLALEPREQDDAAALAFVRARSVGERLQIVDQLSSACESSEEPQDAWNDNLEVWAETCRLALTSSTRDALVLAEGIVTSRRFVGGAFSPRLPLEAAALRLASSNPLVNLFPSPISPSLPRIFSFV